MIRSLWTVPLLLVAFAPDLHAQRLPYDVFPPAARPYYRVRYEAGAQKGELVYPVNYTIWIPKGVKALRGVIVHQHGCGEGSCKSGLTGAYDLHWQALAKKHDCALLSPSYEQPDKADCQMWCDPRNGSDAAFQKCLVDLGVKSGHPELSKVPWALWGHSGGGHWCGGMVLLHPERVAAAWLRSGVPMLRADPKRAAIKAHMLPDAALKVPVMCNLGTKEGVTEKGKQFAGVWPANEAFFNEVRSKGGLISVAIDPLSSHECGNQRYFAIPWLDACLTARLPKISGDPLKAMPTDQAWLAPITGGEAVPTAKFAGEPLKAGWLPNEAIAKAWMQYVKDTAVTDITPPPAPTNLRLKGNELTWEAGADLESGLASFIVERDGKFLAKVPEQGKNPFGRPIFQNLQYSDTPTQPLVPMRYTDTKAELGKKHTYRVITVNTVGLKSMPSAGAGGGQEPAPVMAPWGISSSAGSTRNVAEWFPKMSAGGVTTVRLFPEWRDFEPTKGTWQWDRADALVEAAAKNKIEINAILMGSAPGDKKIHAFPMDNLDGWSNFVSTVVGRYKKRIHCWEVWNEGNGGFNDGKHTTTDYAKLAAATYAAAKKADPQAKIGLTVASFDAPYLNQAILALAKEGKPNSFDYLCIHPYEIADHLGEADGEIPFLWMTRILRDLLKASAPERAGAEIWITEVARRVEKRKGHVVTEEDAAKALAKIYTMAIAQGIARTQWFEAQDPVGEDQGFGLLARNGAARASYGTFKTLTTHLGAAPRYLGWVEQGQDGKGYGFVFQGKDAPILVAWMPAGQAGKILPFTKEVKVIDTSSGAVKVLGPGQSLTLTDTPVLVANVPVELITQAQANAGKNFPWGGDFSTAKAVHCEPGISAGNRGVFQVQRAANPTVKFADGSTGILSRGDIGQAVSFYVHPSFANFQTKEYFIRVRVRRVAPGNVGMNLNYEVADSQGRTPYKNRGQWFGLTAADGWQTYTWHVTDACFSKMWGYDFSLRPEQSVPFVIGKVEVSTIPFK